MAMKANGGHCSISWGFSSASRFWRSTLRNQEIKSDAVPGVRLDSGKLLIVFLILALAIATNWALDFPAAGVWIAIFIGATFRKTPWSELQKAWQGTVFLVSLVLCASLMPVEQLPAASWITVFGLGFVSAVFDNIPLTKLCLVQGGYDWGMLANTVGFGGSMIWFGSSAGVALSNQFPEAKDVFQYVKNGWHVTLAYVVGFTLIMGILGWQPHPPHKKSPAVNTVQMENQTRGKIKGSVGDSSCLPPQKTRQCNPLLEATQSLWLYSGYLQSVKKTDNSFFPYSG